MQFPLMALDDIVNCRLNTNECARKRKRCQRQIIMMIIIERFKGAPWTSLLRTAATVWTGI